MSGSFEVLFTGKDDELKEIGEEVLEGQGLDVDTESLPERAVNSIRNDAYDAVVSSDFSDVSSVELLEEIRGFSDIPFIVIANEENEEMARKSVNLDASGYFRSDSQSPEELYQNVADKVNHSVEDRTDVIGSIITHDMGNIINRISGYATLIEAEGEHYNRLISGIEDAESMMRKIREFREIKGATRSTVDIDESIRDAIGRLETVADQHNVDIVYESEPYSVEAGPLLETMFYNIIENSIEHSGGSTVRIDVEDAGDYVHTYIQDDGQGLPNDISDDLIGDSVGVGTYIIGDIADQYDLDMEIESGDTGTTYAVKAPKHSEPKMEKL